MGTLLRVLSGIVFLPLLIVVSRRGGAWTLFLFDLILLVACWEFYALMEAKGVHPAKKTGVFAALVLSTLAYAHGTDWLGIFLVAFLFAATIRELFRSGTSFPVYDIATTVFGVMYVGWLMIHLILLRELPREVRIPYGMGSDFLLYAFLLAWSGDTGAYFVGLRLGRHKLWPRVSPAKSVEGAVGGFLATVGAAYLGRAWFVRSVAGGPLLTGGETLALGVLVGLANQTGDLVESLIKRDAHVKDASGVIPGHGGVLDRFDSLLFSAPVTYYFLRLMVFP